MRCAFGALAVAAAACQPRLPQPPELPDDVAWIASIALFPPEPPEPARVLGSALVARGAGVPLSQEGAEQVLLLGWRAPAIAAVAGTSGGPRPEQHLRSATSCEETLPPADHVLELAAGRSEWTEAAVQIPPLTAEWVQPECRFEPGDLAIQNLCEHTSCRVRPFPRAPCAFELTGGCEPGPLSIHVNWRGEACPLEPNDLECEHSETGAFGESVVQCKRGTVSACTINVYAAAAPLPFDVKTATVVDVEDAPPSDPPPELFRRSNLDAGWLWDHASAGDRYFVSSPDPPQLSAAHCPYAVPDTEPYTLSRLTILEADSMRVIGTATAPPCLFRLAPDPVEPLFYGTSLSSSASIELHRFDTEGRITKTLSLPLAPISGPMAFRQGLAIEVTDAAIAVVIGAVYPRDSDVHRPAGAEHVAIVDRATMRLREPILSLDGVEIQQIASHGGGFLITDEARARVFSIDATPRIETSVSLHSLVGVGDYTALEVDPETERFIVALSRQDQSLRLFPLPSTGLGGDPAAPSAYLFEAATDPVSMAEWPGTPRLIVLSASYATSPGARATVTVFDPRTSSIRAGAIDVGSGVLSRLRYDPRRQEVVGLLPWSGKILRLRKTNDPG